MHFSCAQVRSTTHPTTPAAFWIPTERERKKCRRARTFVAAERTLNRSAYIFLSYCRRCCCCCCRCCTFLSCSVRDGKCTFFFAFYPCRTAGDGWTVWFTVSRYDRTFIMPRFKLNAFTCFRTLDESTTCNPWGRKVGGGRINRELLAVCYHIAFWRLNFFDGEVYLVETYCQY